MQVSLGATRAFIRAEKPILFCVLALLAARIEAAPTPPQSASAPGLPVVSGAGGSFTPTFSGDGRFVVFVSQANNLVTNDNLARYLDVFVRDLALHRTLLVSVNSSGIGGGDGNSNLPTISSNGQFIAFESAASNLAGTDTNGAMDVFVRDMSAGTTRLVSVSTNGVSSGNGPSSSALITSDGRWVVFESSASDLVANDTNGVSDIFVRDLLNETTSLVSVGQTNASSSPNITPDGHLVAFLSPLTNPAPGSPLRAGVYVRDLQSNTTVWISAALTNVFAPAPAPWPLPGMSPVLSADGRFVAYKAAPLPYDGVSLFRYELRTGSTVLLAWSTTTGNPPEISADGRFVAYEDGANVWVWDGQSGSNILASARLDGTAGGNLPSSTPVLAADGSKVLFLSAASDLVTNVGNGFSQIFLRDLVAGTTSLVSSNSSGGPSQSDIDVTLPAISGDGRLVAFESVGDDLINDDHNLASDVFVRDLQAGTTSLVSEHDQALPPATGVSLCSVLPNGISADGQVLLFLSRDGNLAMGDTNGVPDIFVRDLRLGSNNWLTLFPPPLVTQNSFAPSAVLSASGRYAVFPQQQDPSSYLGGFIVWRRELQTGADERASVSWDGQPLTGFAPAVSADGRMVAFQSSDSLSYFLPGLPVGGSSNIIVRNFESGTNELISASPDGGQGGNYHSTEPFFSPNGRWVVFASLACDLVTNNISWGARRLYARDRNSLTTSLVSLGPDNNPDWAYARGAVFSADSRYVAWVSGQSNVLVTGLFDQAHVLVCSNCQNPSMSGDGRLVAYETLPSASSPFRQVFVRDLQSGATNLVSISRTGGPAGGHSTTPQISPDGRFVAFASKASDLVDNDTNGVSDIFVRDRLLGATMLVSLNAQGTGSGNSASSKPLMAADGRTVVFQSFANDLIAGDYNDRRDIFVLRLGGVDSDGDGLDDDWEMTYFGDLSRDGTGDFDHDGQTDREEFLAGTNPTSDESLLRVITVSSINGGNTTLIWLAVPGRTYRVQFKDSVEQAEWQQLPVDVTAIASTASAVDSGGTHAHRFYRVLRLP
jgi:Tol biopolymer transport system component